MITLMNVVTCYTPQHVTNVICPMGSGRLQQHEAQAELLAKSDFYALNS